MINAHLLPLVALIVPTLVFSKNLVVYEKRVTFVPLYLKEGDYGDARKICETSAWTDSSFVPSLVVDGILDSVMRASFLADSIADCQKRFEVWDDGKIIFVGYCDGYVVDFRNGEKIIKHFFGNINKVFSRLYDVPLSRPASAGHQNH